MFRLLFLGNGWADFAEILYAIGVSLVTSYAVVTGGASLRSARAHVQRYPTHRASVSQKRLGRLCSNLVCGLGFIN